MSQAYAKRAGRIERGIRAIPSLGLEELDQPSRMFEGSAQPTQAPRERSVALSNRLQPQMPGNLRVSLNELDKAIQSYDMAITRLIKLSESL
jgi:hypothetical protein